MSKMSELDLMIRGQIEPIHDRLLQAQKDIVKLKDAGNADHRLIEMLFKYSQAQTSKMDTMSEQILLISEQVVLLNLKLGMK